MEFHQACRWLLSAIIESNCEIGISKNGAIRWKMSTEHQRCNGKREIPLLLNVSVTFCRTNATAIVSIDATRCHNHGLRGVCHVYEYEKCILYRKCEMRSPLLISITLSVNNKIIVFYYFSHVLRFTTNSSLHLSSGNLNDVVTQNENHFHWWHLYCFSHSTLLRYKCDSFSLGSTSLHGFQSVRVCHCYEWTIAAKVISDSAKRSSREANGISLCDTHCMCFGSRYPIHLYTSNL